MDVNDSRLATAFATLVLAWAVTLTAMSLGGAPGAETAFYPAPLATAAAMR